MNSWTCFTNRFILVLVVCTLALVRASAQVTFSEGQKPEGGSIVKGRVIYADTGQPLRRAEVFLVPQDEFLSSTSVTDRNGEFVFSNVGAGQYYVVVNALDIVSPLSSMSRGERSLKLKIALGQIDDGFSEVTVDGRSAVKTEIRASRSGVITGRVMTEDDEPIAKAKITIYQIVDGKVRLVSAATGSVDDNKMFETDSRGVYRIAGLATGEYIVRASESNEGGNPDEAADGSYTNGSMMVAFYPKALRVQDATSVKVQQGSETKDVDIRLTERIGYRVSGTVLFRGRPVASAEIRLTRDEPEVNRDPFESPQARTDDKGQWEIRTVPDGKYTLTVSTLVIGMVAADGESGRVATTQRELIVEGGDVTNLNLEVFVGAIVTGTISVEGGTALPERLMIKLDPSEAALKRADVDLNLLSAIDPKGVFEIAPLPAGSYQFGFISLGTYYVKSITLKRKDLLRNPIKLVAGQSLAGINIVLSSELVSLSGRVVEKDDKSKPLSNATVLLFPVEAERRRMSDEPIAIVSDKEGHFAVKAAPGEYFAFVVDRRRKDVSFEMPTEASLVKNASALQKIKIERGDEKRVVEVVGP